ncbi:nucleotide-binding universal stress UspA family protein [Rhodobacter sp. JA431]|uniref:universal stress protein n=1 Tax=Rhodobacter sp. JA431 TaxID=570013 RepID=UPI000BD27982|nr:universal stress protein [Rhodobacter sp. JA431]SOC12318.1 nucleotide-binding universal stress UspA family protein [Rhodobacter sp. JA431]
MFKKIMVPVDLRHLPAQGKALSIAADLAKTNGAQVIYVTVTSPEPNALGRTPAEVEEKLNSFVANESAAHGHDAAGHLLISHDPAAELDAALIKACDTLHADLVVMATHLPNVTDYLWSSHGGALANHVQASVFLVRA